MARLGFAIGLLLVGAVAALPAYGQAVKYDEPQPIPVEELPLSLAVEGWPTPGFTRASREHGKVAEHDELSFTRYLGLFSHGAYRGEIYFVVSSGPPLRVPSPVASISEWTFLHAQNPKTGVTGSVTNGRMAIDYVLIDLTGAEPRSCFAFTGAVERWQMRGYLCSIQPTDLSTTAQRFIKAISYPGLFVAQPMALPVLRATTAPGGQEIVAGTTFDPRTMPFVTDAARAKLQAYVTAPEPKALAVHRTGAVTWFGGQSSESEAIRRALERCAFEAQSPCALYAVGNQVVFHHDALIDQPVVNSAAPTPTAPLPRGSQATALSNAQLVAHLERATVLVVALHRGGASIGTGFFVSPDRLLTNRHVVDGADSVRVTSRALGKPYEARLVAKTNKGAIGAADYALLEVPGIVHEQLTMTTLVAKLQEVIAAGYPGITISNDADYRAFAQGDRNAAPDLVITRGEINAIQINASKTPTFAHTALISEGNSGGPLVDRCGRVVGINSYIAAKTTVTGFAIASPDLIEFLTHNGVRPNTSAAPCAGAEAAR